ncbi:tyrosine-protein phosphatase [Dethiobacter alkaliphilus]|uniref:protein-tyrosine-phosphatase n=1 Tax=Dethiobacter alkaliphilus AHT 1 TaxID=555088 RepID=C0GGR7_DETAL|nr:CpsB/CapC family capsule biosynthesis tyrosine phosphatase [Dethiobacter alkaliphilus]EEG77508.1 Protein-tyrosine-phosphatase [Dethiobacter alkaliphilus AHT 1]
MSFIDIHCHLIPEVDDGARDMDHALVLAQSLVATGFSTVIATPHYGEDYSSSYQSHIQKQYNLLVENLKQEGVPLSVFLGGEILLTPQVLEQAQAKKLPTLHDTPYVLLELPFYQPVPTYAGETIFQLQALGYKPILAHPERILALHNNYKQLDEFGQSGVLFQINAGSLAGRYGKAAKHMAAELLKRGSVHFLATDTHNSTGPGDFTNLKQKSELPIDELVHNNPARLLSGGSVASVQPPKAPSLLERLCKHFS